MNSMHVKKGDKVRVLSGKDKGKEGVILRALPQKQRVVVEKVKSKKSNTFGYDAAKNDYGDMVERGITDPTKVTRSALQNAASIAAMVLTTESLVTDIPAPEPAAPAAPAGGMY